jgi:hypothetical protein
MDPDYNVDTAQLRKLFEILKREGAEVGLHQSFDAWHQPEVMTAQRTLLSSTSQSHIDTCRQHWLRFSWKHTWQAQASAGFIEDTTLMFNDRPGFRASAAVSWTPYAIETDNATRFTALPTVFMDSHFYDYCIDSKHESDQQIRYWLEEIQAVHGESAMLWHTHTLAADYGWKPGFVSALKSIRPKKNATSPDEPH